MFKRNILTLVAVSACCASLPALALTTTPANSIYVSGDIGYGALSTPDKNIENADGIVITDASHSNGHLAGGGNVGFNHAFTRNFLAGSEFGYDYNGQSKYTEDFHNTNLLTLRITSQDFHLLATATYLMGYGFDVFGKAGAAYVTQTAKTSGSSFDSDTDTENGYEPMIATGVGYQFKMVNIFAQYSHIFANNASNFDDLTDNSGNQKIVSVDTFKLGAAVSVSI
jgi:outer membrane immunogenic protein